MLIFQKCIFYPEESEEEEETSTGIFLALCLSAELNPKRIFLVSSPFAWEGLKISLGEMLSTRSCAMGFINGIIQAIK